MTRQTNADWNAAVYHRVSQPQVNWGRRVLARLEVRGDETVLDAGCGTGRLTAELLERLPNGRVIALDRSASMIEAARAWLAPRFGDRVSFLQADVETIDLETLGTPVDLIFSTAMFHWVLDHPRLFASLYGVLRPGGWLVAQCGGGPNLARLRERADAVLASPPFVPYFAGWSGPWEFADAEVTAARLRAAGFSDVETDVEPAPTTFPDRESFAEFLTNVVFGAHLARMPDEEMRRAFIETLTEQAAEDDPPFLLDYWRLNLRGRRPE